MVRHIVFFRLKERNDPSALATGRQEMKRIFEGLPSLIPAIREYHVGLNVSSSPNAWDVVIDSTFDSEEKLNEYRDHPAHREAVEKAKPLFHETAVVDYLI